jgi:hypothetical protein
MVFAVKGVLKFDPNEYDYGPATAAIRSIVLEWVEVDWFEPTGAPDEELVRMFQNHNALAHHAAPELFANAVNVRVVSGGWSEFSSWCKRVRAQPRWDWKFSVLKKLSHEHSKTNGWSLETHAPQVPLRSPKPGDLFLRFITTDGKAAIVWNGFLPAPELQTLGRPTAAESAQFYFGHAQSDAFSGIQWQLAEKRGDLSRNPFVPLLQCYRSGGYPFSLDRDTVVMFRFIADEGALPKATLLTRSNR